MVFKHNFWSYNPTGTRVPKLRKIFENKGSYTEVYRLVLTNMESMIHYFKLVTEGYTFTLGQTYLRQEAPKGELGCYILHGETTHPCRVKIRTPDYTNLQALNVVSTDHYLADLIAILATVDFVLGSVDRSRRRQLELG